MSASPSTAPWSLRRKLARGLVLTALLPVMLFGVALLVSQWQRGREDLMVRMDANARLNANVIDDFLEAHLAGVRLLADRLPLDASTRQEELSRLLLVYPSVLRVVQAAPDGHVVAASDTRGRVLLPAAANVAEEDWFMAARNQFRPTVSDVFQHLPYGPEAVVGLSAPLLRGGAFVGALQAEVPVQSFARLSATSLARRNLDLLLLDRGGRVIYAGNTLRLQALQPAGPLGERLRAAALTAERHGRAIIRDDLLRGDAGAAYAQAVVMRNGWTLVLVVPRAQLLWPIMARTLPMLVGLVTVTLIGVLWALWRQRQLLRMSIGRLLASLRGYALGGRMDEAQTGAMPEELQPLAAGVGELGARMNAAFLELRQVLDEREYEIASRTDSLRQAVEELDRLSRTDEMTGSLNYRGFIETGERLWKKAHDASEPLSVLALDIDHFKRYNDLYGHAEGDGALRRFAGSVRSALLHADDVLARPGGEEFTVFLPRTTHAQALEVGQRVCQRVRDADIAHAGSPLGRLTVSVGVATLERGDDDIEEVLRRADAALYRAKANGRDRISD